jgi:hypothetical protein
MKSTFFPAGDRGSKDIGWLKSRFSFSFSDYCNPTASAFGTLVAFNDDILQPGKGFGTHPHANMEIISVMLQGRMNHRDSMGYSTEVSEGGVQIMSAGTGLFHEEYNIGEEDVHFLQIWIQPKLQDIRPRYQARHFPRADRKNKLQLAVSSEEGMQHCWINQNARVSLGYFDAGSIIDYGFRPENKCLFVFCIRGLVELAGHKAGARDAVGIWESSSVQLVCREESEFIIIETPVNQK